MNGCVPYIGYLMRSFVITRNHLFSAVLVLAAMFAYPATLQADTLRVFAASSLTNSIGEIIQEFSQKTGIKIYHSFAASSVLARQIINGAPADIYISANAAWMDEIEKNDVLVPGSRTVIASNEIALITSLLSDSFPLTANGVIEADYPLIELIKGENIIIGNPAHVPVGIYTKQSLRHLGIWDELTPSFIRLPNVRAVLTMVERGEASFGFVYASDVQFSDKVRQIGLLPSYSHDPIHYTAGIVTNRIHPNIHAFMQFLVSKSAVQILTINGLLMPMNQPTNK
jgi:molybdate transport system substrate-binding protein